MSEDKREFRDNVENCKEGNGKPPLFGCETFWLCYNIVKKQHRDHP